MSFQPYFQRWLSSPPLDRTRSTQPRARRSNYPGVPTTTVTVSDPRPLVLVAILTIVVPTWKTRHKVTSLSDDVLRRGGILRPLTCNDGCCFCSFVYKRNLREVKGRMRWVEGRSCDTGLGIDVPWDPLRRISKDRSFHLPTCELPLSSLTRHC